MAIRLAIFVYYLYFAVGALHARFATDDMMNLGYYWGRGFWACIQDNILFWRTAYRPMGALFYLPIYHIFGLNPLPYRIIVLLILAANVYLTYRVAELVVHSKAAAALAAMVVCANVDMVPLYYSNSQIYDILAYFFTLLTLFLYIRVRTQERVPTALQGVFIVSAYIAALNSKEIAVVGAGWLLAYEVLFHRPRKLLLPLILSVLALIYTAGKLSGSESLARLEGYAMEVSLHRFVVNNLLYASQMLHTRHLDNGFKLMAALGALTLLCWMLRKPQMWWCGFLICTANLPLSFEIVSRGGASLYLPLFGWALLPGIVITSVWRSRVWRWRITALAACGIAYMTLHPWKQRVQMVLPTQNLTWSVISQIRDLGERPVRHSKIIFLNDPFPEYDTYFIAQLVWNDPTLQITLGNKLPQPPSPQELEAFNWVLAFDGGRCVIIKAEHP